MSARIPGFTLKNDYVLVYAYWCDACGKRVGTKAQARAHRCTTDERNAR